MLRRACVSLLHRARGSRGVTAPVARETPSTSVISYALQEPDETHPSPQNQEGKRSQTRRARRFIYAALESHVYAWVMLVPTFFALFAADIAQLWFEEPVDNGMVYIPNFIALLLWTCELGLSSWAKHRFNLFFFLDIIATLSLVPYVLILFGHDIVVFNLTIARAGRVARAVPMLVRIARVSKTIVGISAKRKSGRGEELIQPSTVGKRFEYIITRNIVVGTLAVFIAFALFTPSVSEEFREHGVQQLEILPLYSSTFNRTLNEYVRLQQGVLYLRVHGEILVRESTKGLRFWEIVKFETDKGSMVHINERPYFRDVALANILGTLVVIIVLLAETTIFQHDVRRLFLRAIDRMCHLLSSLQENPLMTVETTASVGVHSEVWHLEGVLGKLGGLLQSVFGEAGSKIISHNLTPEGQINPMIPGRKVKAIFGFIHISHFDYLTECLQDMLTPFVNVLADTVHRFVVESGGAPNKNIGDSFLVVWKLGEEGEEEETGEEEEEEEETEETEEEEGEEEEEEERDEKQESLTPSSRGSTDVELEAIESDDCSRKCSMALRSFLAILRHLNNAKLADMHEMLGSFNVVRERLASHRVSIGLGLHMGWAIEGAVGSLKKVDATYLSPHVNLSARVESLTKHYCVNLLFSGTVACHLDAELRERTRLIDRVMVKGSKNAIELFTYDDNVTNNEEQQYYIFRDAFSDAIGQYLNGNWGVARELLRECHAPWGSDGPTAKLLEFMGANRFVSPADWAGCRKWSTK